MGLTLIEMKDIENARVKLEQAEGQCMTLELKVKYYVNLARIYTLKKDHTTALEYLQKTLEIEPLLGNNLEIANRMQNIGCVYQEIFDLRNAIDWYGKAYKLYKKIDNKLGQAETLNNLGLCYLRVSADNLTESLRLFKLLNLEQKPEVKEIKRILEATFKK